MRKAAAIFAGITAGVILAISGTIAYASRNASGTYSLPAGNPVVTGSTISSTWANNTLSDIAAETTNSLDRNGRGAMLAPIQGYSGSVTSPGYQFASDSNSGLYRAGAHDIRWAVNGADVLQCTTAGAAVTGTLASSSDFAVNTNKFNVTAASGNTAVAGTLSSTGNFAVNTNKFNVTATNGNTTVAGTLGVTGDVAVNTNKFNVTASNGNTAVAGTVAAQGDVTAHGRFECDDASGTGSVINGSLTVTGSLAIGSGNAIAKVLTYDMVNTFGVISAGSCATATASVSTAATNSACVVSPDATVSGAAVASFRCWVSSAGTVSVNVCAIANTTLAAATYHLVIINK